MVGLRGWGISGLEAGHTASPECVFKLASTSERPVKKKVPVLCTWVCFGNISSKSGFLTNTWADGPEITRTQVFLLF
jgi:hypothetical protein